MDKQGNGFFATVADPVNTLTGEFYVDDVDLTLPGPMPLQVRRNYGSQNLSANQLGHGWKLSYMPSLVVGLSNNVIYSAEMEGSVLAFGLLSNNVWAPTTALNPTLNNDSRSGVGSVANRFNARLLKTTISGTNTYYVTNSDGSLRIFVEKSFPLSAGMDRLRPYLTTWYDCLGNYYQFEYGTNSIEADYGQVRRIVSSSGNILRFEYDPYGRIVEAYSADGRRVQYEYDQHGDLIRVTRPDSSELEYEYQLATWTTNGLTTVYSTHLLTFEVKPDSRLLKNEYDDKRRVITQWATVGSDLELVRNATFRYTNNFVLTNLTATLTGNTTVLDWTNNAYTYAYSNGLMRKVTDPLGGTVTQTWYEESENNSPAYPRSLKTVTDKRGLLTTFLYDSRGNITNTTLQGDLRGDGDTNATATTSAVYTNNNLKVKSVDPSGNTTLFFYTNSWLVSRTEFWPSNATAPQVITNLYVYYMVTNGGKVAFGLKQKEIRAAYSEDAATREWGYDSRGFVTAETSYTGTADPAVTLTQSFNNRGELVQQTDAAGRSTLMTYDPNGNPESREVYEAGESIPLAWEYSYYNQNGQLTWHDGPRYNPEDYSWRDYDGAGRKYVEIHWRTRGKQDGSGVEAETGDNLYATTFYEYDPFNNLTKVTDPRGNYSRQRYDALGQVVATESYDAAGTLLSTNGMAYNLGGDVVTVFNPLGGKTDKQYTSTGKLSFQGNPDGSTNAWRYREDGRLRREIRSNGAYEESSYDDANRRVTRIFYSAAGAALATNVVEMDRRGNVVKSIDAEFYVSTNLFDGLDRIKVSAGSPVITITDAPALGGVSQSNFVQQVTRYAYDASGQTLTVSNAFAEKTVTTRDAVGRTTLVQVRDSANALIRSTQTIYQTNHHGYTIIEGTGASAIAKLYFTDNDGHSVLALQYPTNGSAEYVWTGYDVAGNPTETREYSYAGGQSTLWATNLLIYDGLNRVRTKVSGDGALTTFGYDAASNPTNQVMPGGLTWSAVYNNAGQRTADLDTGSGGATANANSYTFYSSGAFRGLLQTSTDGRGVTCTHSYDDWLRASDRSYSGGSSWENQTTTRSYNARGLLTSISESFAASSNGPSTKVERTYDAYGQVKKEEVSVAGVVSATAEQEWDSAGRRSTLNPKGGSDYANNVYKYTYHWRADGLMAGLVANSGTSSYSYNDAGLLNSRVVGNRTTSVSARDGSGRTLSISTLVGSDWAMSETLTWRGDGLLIADRLGRSDVNVMTNDDRSYVYAAGSRRLAEERLDLDGSRHWTNSFTYDGGQGAGAGVLTRAAQLQTNAAAWTGTTDGLLRIASASNSVMKKSASGRINGAATMSVLLDGKPMPVSVIGTGSTNWTNQWRATLEMVPGSHQIQARAIHPSGQYTASTTSSFTKNGAGEIMADKYDGSGFLTNRVRTTNGQAVSTQTLYWDGRGRLWRVIERDASQSGFDWQAVCDGFGRRLRTTTTIVTNGVALSAQAQTVDQYFDPQFEFLELGAAVNGRVTWKILGPDLNGRYGGLNGIGGFEAYVPGPELFCPILADSQGNLHAVYDQTHYMLTWYPTRVTGYGAVPGFRPLPFGNGANLDQSRAWHNRGPDITGLVWMGGNYYDPVAGQFIGFDPQGHASSVSGHSYCGDDPINRSDPDGRLHAASWLGQTEGLKDFGVQGFHAANLILPSGRLNEMLFGPTVDAANARFEDWKNALVSDFSPLQGKMYLASAFVGEAAPNFIPVAGAEEAAASVLARLEGWAAKNAPILVKDIGALAKSALGWLDSAAPRLNPANYSFNTGRLFSGVPIPQYLGEDGFIAAEDLERLTVKTIQEQGREFRIDKLETYEFDPDQPAHVRGWLRQERLRVEQGRAGEPRTPPGYEQSHLPGKPARDGYDYNNSRLNLKSNNQLEEAARRKLQGS